MTSLGHRSRLVPAGCAALAVALAVIVMLPSLRPAGWSLSVLPRVDGNTGMGAAARALDPGFHTVSPGAYDGQFYWGIAVDPVATGNVHQSFDTTAYRYGHPLYGWLGWLASAGQPRAVPAALVAINLIAIAVAAFVAGVLGRATGGRGWEGLFVALNPGLLYSAAHDLTEPLSAALLLGGMLAYARGRRVVATVAFGFLILSKEQFVTVPLAIGAWELIRHRARIRDSLMLGLSVVPAVIWWVWLRFHLGAWFTANSHAAFVFPLSGWKRALVDAGIHSYSADPTQNQFGESTIVIVAAAGGLLLVATLLALRLRGPADAVLLPIVAIIACLSPVATIFERDLLRNVAVAVVLVPLVLAAKPLLPAFAPAPPGSDPPAA
jgi:hypothetical protein